MWLHVASYINELDDLCALAFTCTELYALFTPLREKYQEWHFRAIRAKLKDIGMHTRSAVCGTAFPFRSTKESRLDLETHFFQCTDIINKNLSSCNFISWLRESKHDALVTCVDYSCHKHLSHEYNLIVFTERLDKKFRVHIPPVSQSMHPMHPMHPIHSIPQSDHWDHPDYQENEVYRMLFKHKKEVLEYAFNEESHRIRENMYLIKFRPQRGDHLDVTCYLWFKSQPFPPDGVLVCALMRYSTLLAKFVVIGRQMYKLDEFGFYERRNGPHCDESKWLSVYSKTMFIVYTCPMRG